MKKFTALTSSDFKKVLDGMSLREILMISEARSSGGQTSELAAQYFHSLLNNQADLALVVADYFKPLVTLLDARNSGVSIASLANTSGSYTHSTLEFDFALYGTTPVGGLSFALAQTPWHIGEFLSMTSRKISGTSIIYSGLAKRWISPEAFPFMEVTSEHKLEVSEKDSTALISEHFNATPK